MIRAEAREAIWRWREVIVGVLLAAIGGRWAWWSFGVLSWIGIAMVLIGSLIALAGFQRLRFGQAGQGPGIVRLSERQISYFGPLSGGEFNLEDLDILELDPTKTPPVWRLIATNMHRLDIPVNAANSEALFDAFVTLDGLNTEKMLTELRRNEDHSVVIWSRPQTLIH